MMGWVKIEKTTIDKPEISLLAERLGIKNEAAFGLWFRVLAYADSHTADGFLPNMTLDRLAASSHVPPEVCRALALPEIGWLFESGGEHLGVMFRNWERHNGACAKARALDARRQAKHRSRKSASRT